MMLGHFFAAHGVTIATRDDPAPSPLYLPGGVVRFLVIVALLGIFGYKIYDDPDGLKAQFTASLEELKVQPEMPLVILGAFILGVLVRTIVGRTNPPAAWQDIEAWFSLLAFVGLSIAAVIHLIVDTSLPSRLMLDVWGKQRRRHHRILLRRAVIGCLSLQGESHVFASACDSGRRYRVDSFGWPSAADACLGTRRRQKGRSHGSACAQVRRRVAT